MAAVVCEGEDGADSQDGGELVNRGGDDDADAGQTVANRPTRRISAATLRLRVIDLPHCNQLPAALRLRAGLWPRNGAGSPSPVR